MRNKNSTHNEILYLDKHFFNDLPPFFSLSLTRTHTHSCVHIQMYDFCLGCKTCLGPIGKTGHRSWMIRVDKKQRPLMVKLGNIPPRSSNQKPCYPNSFSRTIFQNVTQETDLTSQTTHLGRHSYFGWFLAFLWTSLVAQLVKNPPAVWEIWVGKIPWRRERLPIPVFWPGEFGLGSQRVRHD